MSENIGMYNLPALKHTTLGAHYVGLICATCRVFFAVLEDQHQGKVDPGEYFHELTRPGASITSTCPHCHAPNYQPPSALVSGLG